MSRAYVDEHFMVIKGAIRRHVEADLLEGHLQRLLQSASHNGIDLTPNHDKLGMQKIGTYGDGSRKGGVIGVHTCVSKRSLPELVASRVLYRAVRALARPVERTLVEKIRAARLSADGDDAAAPARAAACASTRRDLAEEMVASVRGCHSRLIARGHSRAPRGVFSSATSRSTSRTTARRAHRRDQGGRRHDDELDEVEEM